LLKQGTNGAGGAPTYYEIGKPHPARRPEPFGSRRRIIEGAANQFAYGLHPFQSGTNSHSADPDLNVFTRETSEDFKVREQAKGFEELQKISFGPFCDEGRQPGSSVVTVSHRTAEKKAA
jgi:hypothetical protein